MQAYIVKRILLLVPTLLGISFIVFIAVRLLPGDLVDQLVGTGDATPAAKQRLREEYHLTGNIAVKYVQWLGDLAQGNLGSSAISRRPTTESLRERLPASTELGILALLVSQLIAIPVGVIAALRQDSVLDYICRSLAILLLAIPSFWLALLVITYGFNWFHWTPPLHYKEIWQNPGQNLRTMWVPALILGAALSGGVMRLTRTTMLEVMREDFVRTARAKGLRSSSVLVRHALRNAMIPVITVVGLQLPLIVGGTVILERIFTIPGMGNFLLDSINNRDYPTVQAIVLLAAVVITLSNLLVDLSYPLIDPRIRYS